MSDLGDSGNRSPTLGTSGSTIAPSGDNVATSTNNVADVSSSPPIYAKPPVSPNASTRSPAPQSPVAARSQLPTTPSLSESGGTGGDVQATAYAAPPLVADVPPMPTTPSAKRNLSHSYGDAPQYGTSAHTTAVHNVSQHSGSMHNVADNGTYVVPPNTTQQSTASYVVPKSADEWCDMAVPKRNNTTRSNSEPLDSIGRIINGVRLVRQHASGNFSSRHYPMRLLKPGNDQAIYADNNNSGLIGRFHVDCNIDVPTQRANGTNGGITLARSGYIDLNCTIYGVSSTTVEAICSHHRWLATSVGESSGTNRYLIYRANDGSMRMTVRVFERSNDKTKKGLILSRLYRDDYGNIQTQDLTTEDEVYTKYSGFARLVLTPNVITASSGYVKMVFNVKELVLGKDSRRTIGSLNVSGAKPPAVPLPASLSTMSPNEYEEWHRLMQRLASLVDNGVSTSALAYMIGNIAVGDKPNVTTTASSYPTRADNAQHHADSRLTQQDSKPQPTHEVVADDLDYDDEDINRVYDDEVGSDSAYVSQQQQVSTTPQRPLQGFAAIGRGSGAAPKYQRR